MEPSTSHSATHDPKPTNDEIITGIIVELRTLLDSELSKILLSCLPKDRDRIPLYKKEGVSELAKQMAPKILFAYLQMKKKRAVATRSPEMMKKVYKSVTTPNRSDLFPNHNMLHSPPHVSSNAAIAVGKKLFANSGISKIYRFTNNKESFVAMSKIYDEMSNYDSTSEEGKKLLYDRLQSETLLLFVNELIKFNLSIGGDSSRLRYIETTIRTPGSKCFLHDMYWLIHKYIEYIYNKNSSSITTSDLLLKFIREVLPVFSAIMSNYYGGEKDIIDFKIYLSLLKKYIEFILQESSIRFEGDPIVVAKSIMDIIRKKICNFVRIAGEPAIVMRHIIQDDIKLFIREGVNSFLRSVIQGGGSRRQIKKYKNITKKRNKQRTKYITSHRTSRYNRKIRKV
jgi:hypothetical protein